MRIPRKYRDLGDDEVHLAYQVYLHSIHYAKVLVSDGLGYNDRPFTVPTYLKIPLFSMPIGEGDYVMHVGPDAFESMTDTPDNRRTLIHELKHVWSGERGDAAFLAAGLNQIGGDSAYKYDPDHLELSLELYGEEQQAQIVEDWFGDGMKTYDPKTGKGDLRFYYIQKEIRGQEVDFNWIRPPIRPLEAGYIPSEVLDESRKRVMDSELLPLLKVRYAANDVAGYGARARNVEAIFKKFDSFEANDMLRRLEARRPDDQVVRYFYEHLSSAERNNLVGILKGIWPY
jgi:hypothetical protein